MPLGDSGSALFSGSAREFITMAPASSLTAHLKAHFGRLYGTPGVAGLQPTAPPIASSAF